MDQFNFSYFPYSNFNETNLDWIMEHITACGNFWTASQSSLVLDPDQGTGVSFYLNDMTGRPGVPEPQLGDAVFYSEEGITYVAFIDDVVGGGGSNPEFISFRRFRLTGPQGDPGTPGGGGTGLTEEIKQALLQLARKVAYIDADGEDYYQDLYDALYSVEPPATLVSIDAVYTQSGTVYNTDNLYSLEEDLVVTANYSDGTSAVIPAQDYTLSGTLTVGTSTITVSYGGMTDTFSVMVTENPAPVTLVSIDAVYTQRGTVFYTDSLNSLEEDLIVTAYYSDNTSSVIPASDYTLSGTLTVGTSTISVNYDGETDTFTVDVWPVFYDYIINTSAVGTTKTITDGEGILTDIAMASSLIFETAIKYTSQQTGQTSVMLGIRSGQTGTKQFGLFCTPATGKLGYWYGGADTVNTLNVLTYDAVHTIKVQPVGVSTDYPANATVNVDGTDYDLGTSITGQTWGAWLGFWHYGIGANTMSSYLEYSLGLSIGRTKIKDTSNNVLHDLRPAFNGTYYGFFDTVTESFYYDSAHSSEYGAGNWV